METHQLFRGYKFILPSQLVAYADTNETELLIYEPISRNVYAHLKWIEERRSLKFITTWRIDYLIKDKDITIVYDPTIPY